MRGEGTDEFISTDEVNSLINANIGRFYDRIVLARGHERYEQTGTFSTVASQASYDFEDIDTGVNTNASSFYELLAVDLRWSETRLEPVPALPSLADRYQFNDIAWQECGPKSYRVVNDSIEFFPTPTDATEVEIRFIPVFEPLTTNNAAFDFVNGWDRAVELQTAIDMRTVNGLQT